MNTNIVKIANYHRELEQFRKGEMVFPRKIQIDPVAFCNHDCPFCMYRYTKDDDINALFELKDMIPLSKIIEILGDGVTLGAKSIEITGGGEPTLHPEFPSILSEIRDRGFEFGMVSNGAWREKFFDDIVDHMTHAVWARFSLDAATPATHKAVHHSRTGDFEKACEAIKALADGDVTVGISFIVQQGNKHELADIVRLGINLGVNYVRFGGVVFEGERMDNIELTPEEHIDASTTIRRLINESNVDVYDNFADRSCADFERYSPGDTCYHSHIAPVIGADSRLYTCCIFKYRPDGMVADLNEIGLAEAWLSGALSKLYEKFDISQRCVRCHLKPNNDFIKAMTSGPVPHLNFI